MIKMLFSDLDGTLLVNGENHSGRVTEENIAAIHKLEQNGVRFGIATSRSYEFLGTRMQLDKPFDTVAFNANLVYCDDHIIDCVTFTNEEVHTLVDVFGAKEDNMSMFITKENDCVFYDYNYPTVQNYILNFVIDHDAREFVKIPLVEHMKDNEYCFIVGEFGTKEAADVVRKRMVNYPSFQCIDITTFSFTVTKDYRDKVTGIMKIADYYGISKDEIAVIGDSFNDVGMLSYFKESYCMSHAPSEVKECAKYVVDSVAECISIIMNKELSN